MTEATRRYQKRALREDAARRKDWLAQRFGPALRGTKSFFVSVYPTVLWFADVEDCLRVSEQTPELQQFTRRAEIPGMY